MVIFLNEKHFICDINFSEILTEECITEVKKLGKIYVYGGEGQIPHFHIVFKSKQDCCVQIMDNAYFTHGVHTTTLNSKECKLLNETLKKKTGRLVNNKEETIWMLIRDKWNMANPHAYIGDCVDQPDYSTIIMY